MAQAIQIQPVEHHLLSRTQQEHIRPMQGEEEHVTPIDIIVYRPELLNDATNRTTGHEHAKPQCSD